MTKIKRLNSHQLKYIASLILGAVLVLSFAPFNQWYCAIIAMIGFYQLLRDETISKAMLIGWFFGLGQFGAGVSWVFVSIHVYGNTPTVLAVILTFAFVSVLALFHLLQALVLNYYFPKPSANKLFLAYPCSWALIEWIRSWFLTGFPWLLVGYSQVHSPLRGYIPIVGEFGITFLVALTASAFLYLWKNRRQFSQKFSLIMGAVLAIWILGFLLSFMQWTTPIGKPISVALVQGNISQSIKWNPKSFRHTLAVYYHETEKSWGSKVIIWPEAAVPIPKRYAQGFLNQMSILARQHHASLFTGIPVKVPNSFSYYNAMIALGLGSGHYYKKHLVPFGEYVPFASLLRGVMGFLSLPMSDMVPGPAQQPDLKAKNILLAPFICYEIAYGQDLFESASKANVLVTISDDAWFGNSLAPFQHVEIGQFRAIQAGRPMLFASNNGITALINAKGEIYKRIPQFQQGVLQGDFQPRTGKTPWLYYGNRPLIIILLSLLWLAVIINRRSDYENH